MKNTLRAHRMHIQHCPREFHGKSRPEKVEFRKELQRAFQKEETIWKKNSYRNKYYIVFCTEAVRRKVEQTKKEQIIDGLK